MWTSPALPGSVHELTAARHHGIPQAQTRHAAAGLADEAYRAAGPTRSTVQGKHLSANQKAANRSIAKAG